MLRSRPPSRPTSPENDLDFRARCSPPSFNTNSLLFSTFPTSSLCQTGVSLLLVFFTCSQVADFFSSQWCSERTDQSDDETKAPAAPAPAAPKVVLPKKSKFAGEDEGDKKEAEVSLWVVLGSREGGGRGEERGGREGRKERLELRGEGKEGASLAALSGLFEA